MSGVVLQKIFNDGSFELCVNCINRILSFQNWTWTVKNLVCSMFFPHTMICFPDDCTDHSIKHMTHCNCLFCLQVRNLKNLGFRVPLAIVNKAHQANQLYPFAISLIESVRTYERTLEKVIFSFLHDRFFV